MTATSNSPPRSPRRRARCCSPCATSGEAEGKALGEARRPPLRRSDRRPVCAPRGPATPILSEESADDPARLDAERVWIVDPLDGTREYGAAGPPRLGGARRARGDAGAGSPTPRSPSPRSAHVHSATARPRSPRRTAGRSILVSRQPAAGLGRGASPRRSARELHADGLGRRQGDGRRCAARHDVYAHARRAVRVGLRRARRRRARGTDCHASRHRRRAARATTASTPTCRISVICRPEVVADAVLAAMRLSRRCARRVGPPRPACRRTSSRRPRAARRRR